MHPSTVYSAGHIVVVLGEALRGSHHHHRHHAVVLTKLSLDPLLDQELEGRHRAEHVQNSEVQYVRRAVGTTRSLTTSTALCYVLSMRWFALEEERVMQQRSVSISLSF